MKITRSNTKCMFADYQFYLGHDGSITFDSELQLANIDAKVGEVYEAQERDGRVVFVKIQRPYAVVPFPPGPG